VRLGRRCIVGVAADVEVVVVLAQHGVGHHGAEARHLGEVLEGVDDLLDVLGQQVVLRAAFEVLAVGVDEQHLPWRPACVVALALAQRNHASRDAGAIEQVGGRADHGLQQVGLIIALPDGAPRHREQHAVRHHGGDHAAVARPPPCCKTSGRPLLPSGTSP
jgi:hypothetical protein